jgi:hypothetical protein
MKTNFPLIVAAVCLAACSSSLSMVAQDPEGAIEGLIADSSDRPLPGAHVTARNLETGYSKDVSTGASGLFRLPLLPIGRYSITVEAQNFNTLVRSPLIIDVSETVRLHLMLEVAGGRSAVTVTAETSVVDTSTNTLGAVVTGREIVDLPLNGRNFTQLGLLQTGAAALTSGLIQAGGPLRQGQTYAVNGDGGTEKWGHYGREKGTSDVVTLWAIAGGL